ncbi:glycine cleavage system protein GcvH [bacterium]|nr:glycine cleavage system protein GcvH [bacterium]
MNENDLLYARSHEWLQIVGDVGTIGITRFAVDQLTDLVYVELPPVGRALHAGDSFGVVESVKAVSDIYAPVAGEVIEANQTVVNDPSLLGTDPYEKGWLIKIRIPAGTDTSHLLSKSTYDSEVVNAH